MYFKLSLRSVKRSLSDFTVYFLTLTVGVCLFYVFNSLSAQQMVLDITTSQKDTISELSKMLTLVSVFVSIILGFLCLFGNSFLLKRRKKEFGLYMTLGMSKAKISSILIIETSIIAFLSLIVGIILGGIASQGMAAFTASLFEVNIIKYQFIFSISAMLKTIGYFICIFVVVMIFNTIMISRYTILDLLTATRKNQTIKLKKTSSAAILWFISLILIIGGYVMASKVGFSGSIVTLGISVGAIVIGTFMFYYSAGATDRKSVV